MFEVGRQMPQQVVVFADGHVLRYCYDDGYHIFLVVLCANQWLVAAAGVNHNVIEECGQRTERGYNVCVCGRPQRVFGLRVCFVVGDAGLVEPCQSALAGVYFDR